MYAGLKYDSSGQGNVTHENTKCKGCEASPIIGTRYECTVCPQFDFCSKCEEYKPHQHSFIKYSKEKQSYQSKYEEQEVVHYPSSLADAVADDDVPAEVEEQKDFDFDQFIKKGSKKEVQPQEQKVD